MALAASGIERASGLFAGGSFVCRFAALAAVVACAPPQGEVASRPNVLLISIDTLRADRLGSYGARSVETPALDRLAAEGVRFEHAYSPVPLTLPAHWTILTGVEPWHHAIIDNGLNSQLPGPATLAERFGAAGYDTAAFVAAFVLHRSFGLDRGFALYDDGPSADAALDELLHATAPADERVGRALAWLGRPRTRPFFLWLHLYDPHAPYDPPDSFRKLYAGRPYDGEIAFVDSQVARLLAYLEGTGIAQQTLVAVVSDHGESLGEHGETTHGVLLYDATLRVPFLLRLPGRLPPGTVRPEIVDLADVAPTVLALAGLPASEGSDGTDLFADGQPASRLFGAVSDSPRRRFGWPTLAAVRQGPWKYIFGPHPELYRTADDPRELVDRAARDPGAAADLERAARRIVATLRSRQGSQATGEVDAEDRARLAALGYLTAESVAAPRDIDPKEAIGLLAGLDRASQLMAEGRLDEADAAFRALATTEPPPLAALEGLGRIARLRGRPAEAEAAFERIVRLDPQALTALAQLVRLAGERGDPQTALTRARRLVEQAPLDGSASRLLAQALVAAGEPAAAEAEWRRGLAAAPRSPWLRLSYAQFLHGAGRREEAKRELDRLVAEEDSPEEVRQAARAVLADR